MRRGSSVQMAAMLRSPGKRMPSVENLWRELEDVVVGGNVRLSQLQFAHPVPTFTGTYRTDDAESPVMVRFWPSDSETGSVYDRHREALFLRHPNVLACLDTGMTDLPDGSAAVYAVYEQPQA